MNSATAVTIASLVLASIQFGIHYLRHDEWEVLLDKDKLQSTSLETGLLTICSFLLEFVSIILFVLLLSDTILRFTQPSASHFNHPFIGFVIVLVSAWCGLSAMRLLERQTRYLAFVHTNHGYFKIIKLIEPGYLVEILDNSFDVADITPARMILSKDALTAPGTQLYISKQLKVRSLSFNDIKERLDEQPAHP
ncbi:MAG: hypothetical protein LKJ29_03975 [Lactobacillus sp.]|jgi:hypothetical protein|uniref:DUF1449 family protein n=1 Tax=Lacticaseibacillus suilingensis TaxID=2799577 RepID=A0ABW4BFC3_9LACO|nr:hypothetical protein [Lacticaseibacillus suilingensis]MCI1893563.1 hypothetical protein [Lactobacillus sp.]MCI1917254.1 hypothetical protein [Lactobacillus sp.]MCI1941195.1 hypothetical protein [Lactobacillus sp.]MCI1971739.1 hypothetical protein [Lactobacillus sp.]MCI2016179.1 hypothetical protein [Lactobacillus sp.]